MNYLTINDSIIPLINYEFADGKKYLTTRIDKSYYDFIAENKPDGISCLFVGVINFDIQMVLMDFVTENPLITSFNNFVRVKYKFNPNTYVCDRFGKYFREEIKTIKRLEKLKLLD
jgi:hypothetical protein